MWSSHHHGTLVGSLHWHWSTPDDGWTTAETYVGEKCNRNKKLHLLVIILLNESKWTVNITWKKLFSHVRPRSFGYSLSFRSSYQNNECSPLLSHAFYITCPFHHLIILVTCNKECRSWRHCLHYAIVSITPCLHYAIVSITPLSPLRHCLHYAFVSIYSLPRRSKFASQHRLNKHVQSVCKVPLITPVQKTDKIIETVLQNILIFSF